MIPSQKILMTDQTPIYLEGMTSVSALISALRSGTARRRILAVYFDKTKKRDEFRRWNFLRRASEELGFELLLSEPEQIDAFVRGHTHGGIAALVSAAEYPALSADDIPEKGFAALLEGAEDPYSLGYSIRSLYAAGADLLILPRRLPEGADAVIARSSAGTSELLPIFVGSPADAVSLLIAHGYCAVSAGIRDSVSCTEADLSRPVLLAVGGEKRGLSAPIAALCRQTVRIPYGREFMGSLSTASSVAVLAFEVLRQNPSPDSCMNND